MRLPACCDMLRSGTMEFRCANDLEEDSITMKPTLLLVIGLVLAAVTTNRLQAEDFSAQNGAPKWKIIDFNRSARAFREGVPKSDGAGITFDFLTTPDNAVLSTNHPSYKGTLLGDLTGKTITAVISIEATPGASFLYYGEPDACNSPANVRLYIQSGNRSIVSPGQFEPNLRWWANPNGVSLATLANNTITLTTTLIPGLWSDWNGQSGTSDPAGFAASVKDVKLIGLSFGGGCFFQNGVGVSGGSAKFRLKSYTVTP